MQTVHLQCNHIKGFPANSSQLTKVPGGISKELDAAFEEEYLP